MKIIFLNVLIQLNHEMMNFILKYAKIEGYKERGVCLRWQKYKYLGTTLIKVEKKGKQQK